MSNVFSRFLAGMIFAFCLPSGAALAETGLLICDLDVKRGAGFSTTPLMIGIDPEVAVVYDPLIYDIYGEPIVATQSREGERVVLKWVVKNYRDPRNSRRANFGYTAKWSKAKGTISVRSHAHGYDNLPVTVFGTCKEEKPAVKGKTRKKS